MTATVKTTAAKNMLVTDADFLKLRNSIHTRADSLQMDIQRYLVGVAVRWVASGDNRPVCARINSLLDALPKGVRSNAIREWTERYLGLVYCTEGDAADTFILGAEPKKAKDLDIEKLTAARWFDMKPEAPYKPLDLAKSVEKLLKDAQKRADSTKGDDIPADLLTALTVAVSSWHNAHIDISANVN